jgi:hypothetical protein
MADLGISLSVEESKRALGALTNWAAQLQGPSQDQANEAALAAIDAALLATIEHMEEQEHGHALTNPRAKIAALWQEASRKLQVVEPQLSDTCFMKGLGWIDPKKWEEAKAQGLKVDPEEMTTARRVLAAKMQTPTPAIAAAEPPRRNLFQWIKDKETRDIVSFLGGGLVILVGGVWTAFVYFDGKEWVKSRFGKEATYYVCMGEHQSECRTTAQYLPCSTDIETWAKAKYPDICVNVKITKISDVGGDKCGYSTGEVTCSTRK